MQKINVCICGGGSQGHISAGVIGSNSNFSVNVLTRNPDKWSKNFKTIDLNGNEYRSTINIITNNPDEIIPQCNIVLFCLPGYANRDVLMTIKNSLKPDCIVGSVFGGSGFFLEVFDVLGPEQKSFSLQRVPFTGRSLEYGKSALLKGYKSTLNVAVNNIEYPEKLTGILQDMFNTPVQLLSHYLTVTLSNSNPILHPVRMFVLFKDWTPDTYYSSIPYMYDTDWDDETSELWVECDNELRQIIEKIPINGNEIPTVLEYYGCRNISELTVKIQSIEPFKNVKPHMIKTDKGYSLDIHHRYFTEDIPYGLVLIKSFGEVLRVPTPKTDMIIAWAQRVMNKNFELNTKTIKSLLDNEKKIIKTNKF